MKNKLFLFASLALLFVSSCSITQEDNPLTIPPNFDEIPEITENTPEEGKKTSSKDVEELRELLLQKQ